MPSPRFIVRAVLLALLATVTGSIVPVAARAATTPIGLQLTTGPSSIVARWTLPTDGSAVSAVIVTRTGPSADGSVSATRVVAPTSTVVLDGLLPGGRYAIGVAFVDGSGTGPTVVRRTTLSSAGLPTLVSQKLEVSNADAVAARRWDDNTCAFYHYQPSVCGHAGTTFRTTGYTAATSNAWWSLSVDTTREFGCLRHGTTEYRPRATVSQRVEVDQYDYWYYEPVKIAADGTSTNGSNHPFTNLRSWLGADEMPHYVCPVGWDVAQASTSVSDGMALLHQGDLFDDPGPIIGVLYLPGSATTRADWAPA